MKCMYVPARFHFIRVGPPFSSKPVWSACTWHEHDMVPDTVPHLATIRGIP